MREEHDIRRWDRKVFLMGRLVKMASRRRKLLGGFIDKLAIKVKSDPSYAGLSDGDKASIEQALNDLREFCSYERGEHEHNARPEGRAT